MLKSITFKIPLQRSFLYHLFFLKAFLLHSNTVIEPASTVDGLYNLVVTTAI